MQHKPPLIPYESFAFVAEPPELPTRREGDTGSLEYVARAEISDENERGITLTGTTQNGEPIAASMTIVAPGVVRILLEGEERDPNRVTLAGDVSDAAVNISLERIDGRVALVSDEVTVRINLDPFHVTFYGADGRPFLDQNYTETNVADYTTVLPFGFSTVDGERAAFHDTFTAEPDEHFYGFGEKFSDLDKRGQQLEMWNYDTYGAHTERAYKNVPFFVSSRGYGIFVDSITRVNFDMAASNNSTFSIVVPDTALDYYVIAGPNPKTIITRYANLVSFPILPPKWAFGLWMSSGFQRDSQDEVLRRARSIREHDVPCDVLHLDCYWQPFGRWSEMLWDEEMFPDPEGMIREVKAMGFKVCLWMNPYIGVESERFTEADEKGYLLKNPEGESCVVELWGRFHPPVGLVDFTNPEATEWLKELLRPLLRQGVDVFKTDFGEGVPADAVAHNGMTGKKLHNLYPLLYNDAVAEVTAEETGRTGMVWGRSTYAGGAASRGPMERRSELHVRSPCLDAAKWSEHRDVRARFLEPRHRWLSPSTDAGALREVGAVWALFAALASSRHDHPPAVGVRRGTPADLSRLHPLALPAYAVHLYLREHRGRNQRTDNASDAARIPHGFLRPWD